MAAIFWFPALKKISLASGARGGFWVLLAGLMPWKIPDITRTARRSPTAGALAKFGGKLLHFFRLKGCLISQREVSSVLERGGKEKPVIVSSWLEHPWHWSKEDSKSLKYKNALLCHQPWQIERRARWKLVPSSQEVSGELQLRPTKMSYWRNVKSFSENLEIWVDLSWAHSISLKDAVLQGFLVPFNSELLKLQKKTASSLPCSNQLLDFENLRKKTLPSGSLGLQKGHQLRRVIQRSLSLGP